jgi:hypothetical protein
MELCAIEGSMIAILRALGGLSKVEVVEKAAKYQNIYSGG